jgi:DNA (cytosine-5)-methyltransferase 1
VSASDNNPKFFAVDFFCGAGGTTRGLIDAGGYVVAGIDKVDSCRETYERNNVNTSLIKANARYLKMDIFDKTASYPEGQSDELIRELRALLDSYQSRNPEIPLLFSICAPCQPFTELNRTGLSDDRSAGRRRDQGLLNQAFKFIQEFAPAMVLSENVAGIQSDKFGGVWDDFGRKLKKAGYVVGSNVVDSSKFGVPQFRKRSIMMGVYKHYLKPELIVDEGTKNECLVVPGADPSSPVKTVREALQNFPPLKAGESSALYANHVSARLTDINKARLRAVKPGGSNLGFSEDLALPCHGRARSKGTPKGYSDVYTRMNPDKPAPTITTRCLSVSNGRFGHFDEKQDRGISLREAAALQSFPDNYEFFGGLVAASKMIGNAVPPKLSEFFAQHMVDGLKDNPVYFCADEMAA